MKLFEHVGKEYDIIAFIGDVEPCVLAIQELLDPKARTLSICYVNHR